MYGFFWKRLFDILFALLAMPFWLVLLVIVGPILYLQDRGSVFYSAPRLGKNGKVFTMFKFRTMRMNAPDIRNGDGSTYNAADDPRVTPFGRFLRRTSLDETPQLLNILAGDMSFIGPRPDLPEHIACYSDFEHRKLEIRPGVTGFSQAYFRNSVQWKERIRNDIYYIDHLSFLFDIKILIKTVFSVLRCEGVYEIHEKQSGKTGKGMQEVTR